MFPMANAPVPSFSNLHVWPRIPLAPNVMSSRLSVNANAVSFRAPLYNAVSPITQQPILPLELLIIPFTVILLNVPFPASMVAAFKPLVIISEALILSEEMYVILSFTENSWCVVPSRNCTRILPPFVPAFSVIFPSLFHIICWEAIHPEPSPINLIRCVDPSVTFPNDM